MADRFSRENRDTVSRSVSTGGSGTGFQSRSDVQMKTANRFYRINRDPVVERKPAADFSGPVFDRDCDSDCIFKKTEPDCAMMHGRNTLFKRSSQPLRKS